MSRNTDIKVGCVDSPPFEQRIGGHIVNRSPLKPSPIAKLPLGQVKATGWLGHQLHLMESGMVGRLDELSVFLHDDESWILPDGKQNPKDGNRCEELPYWLRGVFSLAILTGNEYLQKKAEQWIEHVFENQKDDGYFGPVDFGGYGGIVPRHGSGNIVLMIHALMLDAVIKYYEYSGDQRVLLFMLRFFGYCRDIPDKLFFANNKEIWHRRPCDLIEHIHWCYNHTGEEWLLSLAARFFKRFPHITNSYPSRQQMLSASVNDGLTRRRHDEWLVHHTVDFTHYYRGPGMFYRQSQDKWHLKQTKYWYQQHMQTWGQQPRGIFGADEVIRSTYTDPRQGCETCTMVELSKGFYLLGQITGDTIYADRCEDIMLNHFPASQTPDMKGLHYLTAANQPQLDAVGKHDYANGDGQLLYSPHRFRCCQHNVAMGWPWYVEHMWQASSDNGLVAWLYGPCQVRTEVGKEKIEVSLIEDTEYPFKDTVLIKVTADRSVYFPLYLRVPGWCDEFTVTINGRVVSTSARQQSYLRIEREWKNGDDIEIGMPMNISLSEWPRTGSVSVDRGPLTYSVKIEEEWKRCGGTDEWPEWEVLPTSAWNYGLVIDREDPGKSIEVLEQDVSDQPWTVENAPVELRLRAKEIPEWKLENGMVQELQLSPVRSEEAEQTISMIPLGCARLRMSCLPTINDSDYARKWYRGSQASKTQNQEWI